MPVGFERQGPLYQRQTIAIAAVLAVFTATAIVIGFCLRLGHKLAEHPGQRLARRVQLATAVLWLTSVASFLLWVAGVTADVAIVFRDWPGPLLMTASAAALTASTLTLPGVVLLPAVWRNAPDSPGWTRWRKGRYTAALAIFAAFGILLGAWGALEPWAS